MHARRAGSYWRPIRLPISADPRWNRAMASLSSELSIGELTALLCVIVLALIPLTIWVLCGLESRRRNGRFGSRQRSIRAKMN
jgi:hypothetical protein